ncbi:hypothetical protein CAPTEDRAFT_217428 [Capitella teleta]|uniref:F-box domain-containing protein n=1 Tax=Capitella teleta TaxID=283909 RepID=R7TTK5_CAPTE|nr:hypothetical protein CAPTEDRAFT_217428 [Capitella teleta]|eukprot:ELT94325.1 hypothetical protein CAPTEDRAFT_217428 [Capitella teleta]
MDLVLGTFRSTAACDRSVLVGDFSDIISFMRAMMSGLLSDLQLVRHQVITLEVSRQLTSLPFVISAKIISFLSWEDKLHMASALPEWEKYLHTADAWKTFSTNPGENVKTPEGIERHYEGICWCFHQYGRYMRNVCVSPVHNPIGWGSACLLDHLAQRCFNLRSVRIDHPPAFYFQNLVLLDRYVGLLRTVVENCNQLQRMSLCRLHELNEHGSITALLDRLLVTGVSRKIHHLEFKYPYNFSSPVPSLVHFDQLRQLKCPIHVLNTGCIKQLVSKQLLKLHVLNDRSTLDEFFNEASAILWDEIHKVSPLLQVNYIVQGRSFYVTDLVPNPMIHSFVIDSICNGVSSTLIDSIADLYSSTLMVYAHLATYTCNRPYECPFNVTEMYVKLVRVCRKLKVFVSEQEIPGTAVLLMALNGKLRKIYVRIDKFNQRATRICSGQSDDQVDWWQTITGDVQSLRPIVAKFTGSDWRPLTRIEFAKITRRLLHL